MSNEVWRLVKTRELWEWNVNYTEECWVMFVVVPVGWFIGLVVFVTRLQVQRSCQERCTPTSTSCYPPSCWVNSTVDSFGVFRDFRQDHQSRSVFNCSLGCSMCGLKGASVAQGQWFDPQLLQAARQNVPLCKTLTPDCHWQLWCVWMTCNRENTAYWSDVEMGEAKNEIYYS